MRVLVAPDKFKGSLTAAEVAEAIAEGLTLAGIETRTLPLADGGDGSAAAAVAAGYTARVVTVRGAHGNQVRGSFALSVPTETATASTAVAEVANTCGLHTLRPGDLAPMTATTFGFGQAVQAARHAGARRIILALGGSASTDGGTGMLEALGVVFRDENGERVEPAGATLKRIASVDTTGLDDLSDVELVIAGDVTNPLLGPAGAAAVFGPQKGASADQVAELDAGLQHLVAALPPLADRDPRALAHEPGAGAAGGLACRWLGGRRVPGADFFLGLLGFDDAVLGCDAVVTGEGGMDSQTLGGKLPAVVAARSGRRPVHAVVGRNSTTPEEQARMGFVAVHALSDLTVEDTRANPALSKALMSMLGERIGHQVRTGSPQGPQAANR